MLLTIGGLFLAVLLMIVAGVTRQVWLAKFVFGAVGVWFGASTLKSRFAVWLLAER